MITQKMKAECKKVNKKINNLRFKKWEIDMKIGTLEGKKHKILNPKSKNINEILKLWHKK